jgi:hypothetical protein
MPTAMNVAVVLVLAPVSIAAAWARPSAPGSAADA